MMQVNKGRMSPPTLWLPVWSPATAHGERSRTWHLPWLIDPLLRKMLISCWDCSNKKVWWSNMTVWLITFGRCTSLNLIYKFQSAANFGEVAVSWPMSGVFEHVLAKLTEPWNSRNTNPLFQVIKLVSNCCLVKAPSMESLDPAGSATGMGLALRSCYVMNAVPLSCFGILRIDSISQHIYTVMPPGSTLHNTKILKLELECDKTRFRPMCIVHWVIVHYIHDIYIYIYLCLISKNILYSDSRHVFRYLCLKATTCYQISSCDETRWTERFQWSLTPTMLQDCQRSPASLSWSIGKHRKQPQRRKLTKRININAVEG